MVVIIEMLGAPGAGKTTLLPSIEASCRAADLTPFTIETAARPFAARTGLGRLVQRVSPARYEPQALWGVFRVVSGWHTVRMAIRRPGLMRHVLSSQWRRPSAADARGRRVAYWYLRLMGSYGLLRAERRSGEVVVIDEGFVHRAVQLHSSSVEAPTPAQVAAYLARVPRPDLVVHVDSSVAVCRGRVQERGVWSRLSHRSAREVESFIDNAHQTVTLVRAELGRRGWPVVDVDNDQPDPDAAASALRHELAARLARPHGGPSGPSR
jgi:hypothetical protein